MASAVLAVQCLCLLKLEFFSASPSAIVDDSHSRSEVWFKSALSKAVPTTNRVKRSASTIDGAPDVSLCNGQAV